MKKVDVIIPTYKPQKRLLESIHMLEMQTYTIHKIILMNTEKAYFDKCLYLQKIIDEYGNIEVYHITKEQFDHGYTRHMGVLSSDADIFICLTDDALPIDKEMVEQLVKGLEIPDVAVAYGKQLPNDDCGIIETFTRQFNYPDLPMVKSKEDIKTLGIKTFFCSNVCAAYDRKVYDELEGFINHTIFNEDMIFAAEAIMAGKKIAYVPTAIVKHSHNDSSMQQLRRNFDLGVSQADHPEIFAGIPSEKEGAKLVKKTASFLWKTGHPFQIIALCYKSAFKLIGYKLGKKYKKIPKELVEKLTMNKQYWKK